MEAAEKKFKAGWKERMKIFKTNINLQQSIKKIKKINFLVQG